MIPIRFQRQSSQTSRWATRLEISNQLLTHRQYSSNEKAEIDQWLITSANIAAPNEDGGKNIERLASLNTHLSTRTLLLGSKPSIADIAAFSRLRPLVAGWTSEQRTGESGYHHIVRYIDFIQHAPMVGLRLNDSQRVKIDVDEVLVPAKSFDAKAEKEKKKKEKEATAANASATDKKHEKDKTAGVVAAVAAVVPGTEANAEKKKEKKEKQPKQPKAPAVVEKPLSPALIDLRVGHILKAEQHPNADSLYVSTIACGDAPGTDNTSEFEGQVVRTVCSGLNGLVPLEEMQGRKIVAVCNLKPVTMRGIKSAAMVLAASPRLAPGAADDHKGPVELVNPPDAPAGERIYFEGWEGEPEAVLNPKKKVWDYCQVGFTTTADKGVAFDAAAVEQLKDSNKPGLAPLRTKQGLCTIKSLVGATVR